MAELGIKGPLEYLQVSATNFVSLLFIYMIPIDYKITIFLTLVHVTFDRWWALMEISMENCFDFSKFAGHLITMVLPVKVTPRYLALVTSWIMSKLWN